MKVRKLYYTSHESLNDNVEKILIRTKVIFLLGLLVTLCI